jgi:hypothetical protein
VDEQVPHIVFYEHARPIVEQVPTHEIEVLFAGRLIDGKSKILTTFRRAIIAKAFSFGNLISFRRFPIDGFGGK